MSDVDALVAELPVLLGRAGRAVARIERHRMTGAGLTRTAAAVLRFVGRHGPTSHRDLAVAAGVAPATVTAAVDALELSGEVERVRDGADRRVVRVSITAVGAARLGTTRAGPTAPDLPRPDPAEAVIVHRYLLAVLDALEEPGAAAPR